MTMVGAGPGDDHTSSCITPELLDLLRTWQGRSEFRDDTVTAAPVRGLAATLGRPELATEEAQELPPLWHWLYFLEQVTQHEMGADGHARLGGFLPPVPLPRRMWAGGRLRWHAPLRVGQKIRRTTTIASLTHKAGRTGDLVFVHLHHELVRGDGTLVLSEEQDLVYRSPARPGDVLPVPRAAPVRASWSCTVVPDPLLLFRYSALTFNGHRIHYDRPYATGVECYEGLVVHGPLIATLLADLVARKRPHARMLTFGFRAVCPLLDLHAFEICGRISDDSRKVDLWTRDHGGRVTMQAEASLG